MSSRLATCTETHAIGYGFIRRTGLFSQKKLFHRHCGYPQLKSQFQSRESKLELEKSKNKSERKKMVRKKRQNTKWNNKRENETDKEWPQIDCAYGIIALSPPPSSFHRLIHRPNKWSLLTATGLRPPSLAAFCSPAPPTYIISIILTNIVQVKSPRPNPQPSPPLGEKHDELFLIGAVCWPFSISLGFGYPVHFTLSLSNPFPPILVPSCQL